MSWRRVTAMEERCRFVVRALEIGANKSELCREFGISRPAGDKWLSRYAESGFDGLKQSFRRPHIPVSCEWSLPKNSAVS